MSYIKLRFGVAIDECVRVFHFFRRVDVCNSKSAGRGFLFIVMRYG